MLRTSDDEIAACSVSGNTCQRMRWPKTQHPVSWNGEGAVIASFQGATGDHQQTGEGFMLVVPIGSLPSLAMVEALVSSSLFALPSWHPQIPGVLYANNRDYSDF